MFHEEPTHPPVSPGPPDDTPETAPLFRFRRVEPGPAGIGLALLGWMIVAWIFVGTCHTWGVPYGWACLASVALTIAFAAGWIYVFWWPHHPGRGPK